MRRLAGQGGAHGEVEALEAVEDEPEEEQHGQVEAPVQQRVHALRLRVRLRPCVRGGLVDGAELGGEWLVERAVVEERRDERERVVA